MRGYRELNTLESNNGNRKQLGSRLIHYEGRDPAANRSRGTLESQKIRSSNPSRTLNVSSGARDSNSRYSAWNYRYEVTWCNSDPIDIENRVFDRAIVPIPIILLIIIAAIGIIFQIPTTTLRRRDPRCNFFSCETETQIKHADQTMSPSPPSFRIPCPSTGE